MKTMTREGVVARIAALRLESEAEELLAQQHENKSRKLYNAATKLCRDFVGDTPRQSPSPAFRELWVEAYKVVDERSQRAHEEARSELAKLEREWADGVAPLVLLDPAECPPIYSQERIKSHYAAKRLLAARKTVSACHGVPAAARKRAVRGSWFVCQKCNRACDVSPVGSVCKTDSTPE